MLLLTNNSNTGDLYEWLCAREPVVLRMEDELDVDVSSIGVRFAVSFNYRHIIPGSVIEALGCEVVNVHCSVLPWNRGAAPNFFSYYENTPKGVTVHRLTAGLDKGEILLQQVLDLGEDETFASSYAKLIDCATDLLKTHWDELSCGNIAAVAQPEGGSYHAVAKFEALRERYPFEWTEHVRDWKERNGLR